MWKTDQGIDVKKEDELEDYYNNPRKIDRVWTKMVAKRMETNVWILDMFLSLFFFLYQSNWNNSITFNKQAKTARGVYLLDGVRARLSGAQRHANF